MQELGHSIRIHLKLCGFVYVHLAFPIFRPPLSTPLTPSSNSATYSPDPDPILNKGILLREVIEKMFTCTPTTSHYVDKSTENLAMPSWNI